MPVRTILAQSSWAAVLIISGSFDTLTDYAVFAMLLLVALATSSVFIFRRGFHTPSVLTERGATPSSPVCSRSSPGGSW